MFENVICQTVAFLSRPQCVKLELISNGMDEWHTPFHFPDFKWILHVHSMRYPGLLTTNGHVLWQLYLYQNSIQNFLDF